MKYVAPVNGAGEVKVLADAGADELYCGYQDSWWVERYGDHDSASRRQGAANLASEDELRRVAYAAGERGVPLFLALNARYTEPQLDHLEELCETFAGLGGKGIIASDLGLLWRLWDRTGLECCLSILAVAQNALTLRAYNWLGATRVVLPRFIGPQEAEKLLSCVPGMGAEAMAFFDKCPWVDGYCRHRHGVSYPDRATPDGRPDDAPPLYTYDTTYRTHACLGKSCTYLQPYPCAACYLGKFEAAGVGFAKLGGRGRALEERLRALLFLREAASLDTDAQRVRLYHATFGGHCTCYYGDAIQNRHAIEPIPEGAYAADGSHCGSETSVEQFTAALERLAEGMHGREAKGLTLLVPPLSENELRQLRDVLPALAPGFPHGMRIVVNDLGTLLAMSKEVNDGSLKAELALGRLLARIDDPGEVARAGSAQSNPPRPVWGPTGEPRVLTYRCPPESLLRHWSTPSAIGPSAQAALNHITGLKSIPLGFNCSIE